MATKTEPVKKKTIQFKKQAKTEEEPIIEDVKDLELDKKKEEKPKEDKPKKKEEEPKKQSATVKPKASISTSVSGLPNLDIFKEENVDYRYIMMNYDFTKNKTPAKITKYERALLIGKRAKQIEEGANANVRIMPGQSAIEIAEEELRQRKIPLIIKRPIGTSFEYWKPADMEVFMD